MIPQRDFTTDRRTAVAADKKLLTYHQVAGLLNVDVRTVYRLVSAGKLRPVRFPSRRIVRFRPEAIEAFLKKGER